MDESNTADEAPFDAAAPSVRRSPRWPTTVAWIAIALLVVVAGVGQRLRPRDDQPAAAAEPGTELSIFELQARYMVGAASLLPQTPGQSPRDLYDRIKMLNTGTVAQRLRFIVLAGELAGPQEALDKLDELDGKIVEHDGDVPEDLKPVPGLLRKIFENRQQDKPPADGLSDAERQVLVSQLGWFGELALHPNDKVRGKATNTASADAGRQAVIAPAQRLFAMILGAFVVGGGVGLLGLVGLVILFVVMAGGTLTDHFAPPSGHGGIYAETFAVWLLLFILLSLVPSLLALVGVPEVPERFHMLASGVLSFLSLAALAWPCWRGIPWSQVRRDIGWTTGRGLAIEPLAGLGAYLMTIPLVGLGLLLTLIIMRIQQEMGGAAALGEFDRTVVPSHPIVPLLAGGDRWQFLQALLLASIAAPIIEETAFRGVLYRHLRDATGRWGRMWSFLASALFNGVIFALIHPQGMVAVPALTAVAGGLTLAREWRGTLLPSILLHGVHNGLLLLLIVAMFS